VAEEPPCLYVPSAETNDLGIRDCSPARKNLSNRSISGPFAFAWKSHDPGATLSSLTWPSTASFAPATWSGKARQLGIIVSDCQDVGTLRDQTSGDHRSRVAAAPAAFEATGRRAPSCIQLGSLRIFAMFSKAVPTFRSFLRGNRS
jgi:hypothetical protein